MCVWFFFLRKYKRDYYSIKRIRYTSKYFFFQVKWKLVNKTLSNQAGVNLIGKWKIEDGKIINADNSAKGFGILDDGKATGTKVTVDETLANDDPGQQWKKSSLDDSGYFTLMNINSGKFLSAVSRNNITIQGM